MWNWIAKASADLGLHFRDFKDFFDAWTWPARVKSPAKIWTDTREKSSREAGVFKCGASELISIYVVFREMIRALGFAGMANMRDQTAALLAVFQCLDIMVAAPGKREAGRLQAAVEECLAANAKANPDIVPLPKHHMALHLGPQLAASSAMDGTFVHERKHETFKRLATTVTNVTRYEKRLSLTMINYQISAFAEEELRREENKWWKWGGGSGRGRGGDGGGWKNGRGPGRVIFLVW